MSADPTLDAGFLGPVLRRLIDEDEQSFDALFDATSARRRVSVAPELAAPLRAAGLVEGDDDQLWGLVRARRLDRRVYFLELVEGEQYHQDVWPETDALLDALVTAPIGRCLDVGTGCGIIAIEAALAGHHVTATDLYESALELARFNARLNGVETIDFRAGHLFEPVAGERFKLVLTAPHYGRVFDQLRLEVLRAAVEHLTNDGRLLLATALEWESGQELAPSGGELAIEGMLRQIAAGVRIRPIVVPARAPSRAWFAFQTGDVPRLMSRHRFVVEIEAGKSGLVCEWPPRDSQPTNEVVPLSRLTRGAQAAIVTAVDVDELRVILEKLAQPSARFDALPFALLDACRFGARSCKSAVGALLDTGGNIRPCTHGEPVARADHSLAELQARLSALAVEAAARRECETCSANSVCSRCLFPAALDEAAYCALIRAHATTLPRLHRLVEVARQMGAPPLTLERWPRENLGPAPAWPELTARWNELGVWLISDGERSSLWLGTNGHDLDAPTARLGQLIGDGAPASELAKVALPARRLRTLAARLASILGADPASVTARTIP